MTLKDEMTREHRRRHPDKWTAASGDALATPSTWERERRKPSRTGDLRGDLLLPLGQATVTAVVGGIIGALVWRNLSAVVVATAVVFAVSWLALLLDTRKLLYSVEKITKSDINKDGHTGEPPARIIRVEVASNEGRAVRYHDLPVSEAVLVKVARAILVQRVPFSRSALNAAGAVSQDEYRKLAQALLEAGLVVELPPNKREVTAAGRAFFKSLLD